MCDKFQRGGSCYSSIPQQMKWNEKVAEMKDGKWKKDGRYMKVTWEFKNKRLL